MAAAGKWCDFKIDLPRAPSLDRRRIAEIKRGDHWRSKPYLGGEKRWT